MPKPIFMNINFPVSHAARVTAALLLLVGVPAWAADDDAPWFTDVHSAARLIAGTKTDDVALRAGVEIKLDAGWKTYWRYPGDSGVPPRFDFSGSDNVANVKVLWPAPHRLADESGTSIGYKDGVIFPLRVTPKQAGKPVRLKLKLEYAVCEKLCVPAEAKSEVTLTGTGASDARLAAVEACVPKPGEVGDGKPLSIRVLRRVSGAAKPLVMVEVAAPDGADVQLFVEGPTPDWALPVPTPAQGAPAGTRQFGFELDGLPPGADPASKSLTLTLTAVAGDQAIEVHAPLE